MARGKRGYLLWEANPRLQSGLSEFRKPWALPARQRRQEAGTSRQKRNGIHRMPMAGSADFTMSHTLSDPAEQLIDSPDDLIALL